MTEVQKAVERLAGLWFDIDGEPWLMKQHPEGFIYGSMILPNGNLGDAVRVINHKAQCFRRYEPHSIELKAAKGRGK